MGIFSKDKVVNNYVALQMACLFVINASFCFGHYVGLSYEMVSTVSKMFVALLFIGVLIRLFRFIPQYVYVFLFASVFVALIQFAFFPQNEQFSNTLNTFYVMCFTSYMAGALITDASDLRKRLLYVSYFCAAISALLVLLNALGVIRFLNEWGNSDYSMGFGNACTLPAILLFWHFFENHKLLDLFAAIVMVLCIISFGSRGPLLGIGVWLVIFIYKNGKNTRGGAVLLITVALALVFFGGSFLSLVGDLLRSVGLESRNIDLLFSGSTEIHMSRREEIYAELLSRIKEDPISVRGINAEYLVLETYAHNIILEMLYQFGAIIGSFFLLYILYRSIQTLRLRDKEGNADLITIVQIFMITVLCQSMISGSIWTMSHFWLWLSLFRSLKAKRVSIFNG